MPYKALPNIKLSNTLEISRSFIELGITTFHEACDYVWKLPYGRTSDRANWALVLPEGKGACSTKHALLKALANELNLNIELVVGIYPMSDKNTPGVGSVLDKYGIAFIPEL